MKYLIAAVSLSLSQMAFAADQTAPLKGTVCFATTLRNTDAVPITCKGLGAFKSISEIYERGYRVVSVGNLNEAAPAMFLVIEMIK